MVLDRVQDGNHLHEAIKSKERAIFPRSTTPNVPTVTSPFPQMGTMPYWTFPYYGSIEYCIKRNDVNRSAHAYGNIATSSSSGQTSEDECQSDLEHDNWTVSI